MFVIELQYQVLLIVAEKRNAGVGVFALSKIKLFLCYCCIEMLGVTNWSKMLLI